MLRDYQVLHDEGVGDTRKFVTWERIVSGPPQQPAAARPTIVQVDLTHPLFGIF